MFPGMSHKNAVSCPSCGRLFFAHSLKFHLQSCALKQANLEIPCAYCDLEVRRNEMKDHLKRCPAAKDAMRRRQQPYSAQS